MLPCFHLGLYIRFFPQSCVRQREEFFSRLARSREINPIGACPGLFMLMYSFFPSRVCPSVVAPSFLLHFGSHLASAYYPHSVCSCLCCLGPCRYVGVCGARTEISSQKTVEELKAHMEKANVARDHYRDCIAKAKDAIAEQQSSELQVPAYEHFAFDFAQQAHIPHHAREVGALYFKVPR